MACANSGRSHVDRDIKPYVCISKDCIQPLQFFSKIRNWKEHMRRTHTAQWIESLHNPLAWKCPVCCSTSVTESASKEQLQKDLIAHMEILHPELDEDDRRNLASVSGIPRLRPLNICPICGDHHQPKGRQEPVAIDNGSDMGDEALTAKEDITSYAPSGEKKIRFDLPTGSDTESDEDGADSLARQADQQSPQARDHDRIEKYIGQHLKALAFYFANRLLDENERDSNVPSRSSVESAFLDLGSLSDLETDDNAPRLPMEEPVEDISQESTSNTDEENEQRACILLNLLQLRRDWGGDRRAPEPKLSPEQLRDMFPDNSHQRSDDTWNPIGPGNIIAYAACTLIVLELCQKISESPSQLLQDEQLRLQRDCDIFSSVIRDFQRMEKRFHSRSIFVQVRNAFRTCSRSASCLCLAPTCATAQVPTSRVTLHLHLFSN